MFLRVVTGIAHYLTNIVTFWTIPCIPWTNTWDYIRYSTTTLGIQRLFLENSNGQKSYFLRKYVTLYPMNTCMDYISWYTTNISESSNGIPAILGGSSAAMIDEMIDDAMFGWSMADVWLMQWSRSPVSQKRFGRKVLPPIASTRLSLDQIRANGIIPQVCWSHLHIQQFCFYPPTCSTPRVSAHSPS